MSARVELWPLVLVGLACRPSPLDSPRPSAGSSADSSAGSSASGTSKAPVAVAPSADLDRLERMRAEDPREGPARYVLARYHARKGDSAQALALLGELLEIEAWDLPLTPEDFPALVDDPTFIALAELARARAPRVEHGPVAFELDVVDLLPEGLAWDPVRHELLVGSMAKREVLAAALDGKTRVLVTPAQDGLMGVTGMSVATAHDRLFVASDALPFSEGYDPSTDEGRAAVVGFVLSSGTTVGTWPAPVTPAQLNDLVALDDGSVLVTDTLNGAVLRKAPDALSNAPLEWLVPEGTFFGANGIVELPGQRAIVVADFEGLHRVSVPEGVVEPLPPPPGVLTLSGIDGLERRGSTLVGIQNAIGAGRVWALELDADGRRLVSGRILDDDHPRYHGPTTGVIVDDRFLYLADAFMQMGDDGMIAAPDGRRHAILALALE